MPVDYLIDEHIDIEADNRVANTTAAYYKLNYKLALISTIIVIVAIAISLFIGYLNHSLIIVITAIILIASILIIFLAVRFLLRFIIYRNGNANKETESEENQ